MSPDADPKAARRGPRPDDGGREVPVVPRAEFASYYGRAVLKAPVWKEDIAYYVFLGGLSAGSCVLAAGAAATGRPGLCRRARWTALSAIGLGTVYLIKDLGRPGRFHHMLRVAKPTSPMSMGTWLLAAYGPLVGMAATGDLASAVLGHRQAGRFLVRAASPAGAAAAVLAPGVAAYTGVLLADTAVPVWHAARRELPFVFTASAAAASGGLAVALAPSGEAGPARRFALAGAMGELAASALLGRRPEAAISTLHTGEAGTDLRRARRLTAIGALAMVLPGHWGALAGRAGGLALVAGSFWVRLGVFRSGVASTRDPRYLPS